MSAPSSAIKYMCWWCSVFSSKEEKQEGEAEGGEEEEEGAMCQSLSSGDTWPLLLSLSLLPPGWRRHSPRCCGGGGDVLACCCGGGHKLRGRDVIEKHNWRKKKEGGRAALHCAIFFSPSFLCRPCASSSSSFPSSSSPFSPFRPYFFAAAFTEICSAQKSPPFFAKMWQFMRRCRAE